MAELKPRLLCLNAAGQSVARKISDVLDLPLEGRVGRVPEADETFENALDHARDLFAAGHPVIGVCAAGILIRAVAPLLGNKSIEPPVIAVAEDGTVVPLLGGHRGGNRLSRQVAEIIGGHAAVTTGGDVALGVALDEPPLGWRLANPEAAKSVMAEMLSGGGARVSGHAPWLEDLPKGDAVQITVTTALKQPARNELVFSPLVYTLGVGCSRNCPPEELAGLVRDTLNDANINPAAIAAIHSIDVKMDEPAVLQQSRDMGVPLTFFSAEELNVETPRLANPSDVVFAEVGTHGVSEAAALAGAGADASLIVEKRKTMNATCALALSGLSVGCRGG